jgi:competence protein ComEC
VWLYLGFGIDLVTRIAGLIAAAPGASLPVRSFAPFAIVFLALAVLSAVIWRSWILRATAIPFAVIGLYGAANGEGFDMAVAPTGEAAAVRRPSGELALLGRGKLSFIGEQWLRADADPRAPADARDVACDELGCVTKTVDGRKVALVSDRRALIEDCARAEIVIAPFDAPAGCGAPILLDRRKLRETGAVTLRFEPDRIVWRMARGPSEDRPWSRAPQRRAERETAEPVAEEDMRVD